MQFQPIRNQVVHPHASAKPLTNNIELTFLFEEICNVAAKICNAPLAYISLLSHARPWCNTDATVPHEHLLVDLSLLAETPEGAYPTLVGDMQSDARYREHPLVTGLPAMRMFAGIPIYSQERTIIGALCIADQLVGALTPHQTSILQTLAWQVEVLLGPLDGALPAVHGRQRGQPSGKQLRGWTERRRNGGERRKRHDPIVQSPDQHRRMSSRDNPYQGELGYPGIFYLINRQGELVGWNHQFEAVTGYTHDEIKKRRPSDFFETEQTKQLIIDCMETVFREGFVTIEADLLTKSGDNIRYSLTGSKVMLEGEPYLAGSGIDISASYRTKQAHLLRHRAVHASTNAILITDLNGRVEYVNPAFEKMTGYESAEVIGRNCNMLQGPATNQSDVDRLREAIRNKSDGHAILHNYRKDGQPFWNQVQIGPVKNDANVVTNFVGVLNDVSDLKRHEAQLEQRANFDSLTLLANRALLKDRIRQAIAHAQRHSEIVIIGFVDLDCFKGINDRLGHQVGDDVLRSVAERLTACVRAQDTVARYGGDEFAFVLTEQTSAANVVALMERLLETISQPLQIGSHTLSVSCSIGISQYPRDGMEVDTLLKHADVAMYRAKESGRNNFKFYTTAP